VICIMSFSVLRCFVDVDVSVGMFLHWRQATTAVT